MCFIFCRSKCLKSHIIPEKLILWFKGFLGYSLLPLQIESCLLPWAGITILSRKEVGFWWLDQCLSLEGAWLYWQPFRASKELKNHWLLQSKNPSLSEEPEWPALPLSFPSSILYHTSSSALHLFYFLLHFTEIASLFFQLSTIFVTDLASQFGGCAHNYIL